MPPLCLFAQLSFVLVWPVVRALVLASYGRLLFIPGVLGRRRG